MLITDSKTWLQGYKTFFLLVLRLVLRTLSLCSTEYDTKNRSYKSFGVRSLLSWIWNTYSNHNIRCCKRLEFRELQSQSDSVGNHNTYCKLHFIKQLNEGEKSQVPCKGHTFGHVHHVCLHGGSSLTGGGLKMKC